MTRLLVAVAVIQAVLIAYLLSQRASAPSQATSDPERASPHADGRPLTADREPDTGRSTSTTAEPSAGRLEATPDDVPASPRERTDTPKATTATLFGTIRYSNGDPVDRWNRVRLIAEGEAIYDIPAQKDGTYAAAGIPPGTYRAFVETHGATGTRETLTFKAGDRIRKDFVYDTWIQIPVKIQTPEGKSIYDALRAGGTHLPWIEYQLNVFATRAPPTQGPPAHPGIEHDDFGIGSYTGQGKYSDARLADGRQGTLSVPDGWPLHVTLSLRSHILETQRIETRPEEIVFTIEPDRIEKLFSGVTFQLTGDGPPSELEGGKVSLQHVFLDGIEFHEFKRDGNQFTLEGRIPGLNQLCLFFGQDLEDYCRVIDLPVGEIQDLGTIHLRKAAATKVKLVDKNGNPVVRASVSPHALDKGKIEHPAAIGRGTNTEGIYTLSVGPGRYFLHIGLPNDGGTMGVDLEAPRTSEEPLVVRVPDILSMNVRLEPDLTSPVHVVALQGEGRQLSSRRWNAPNLWVDRFPAGTYTIVATEGDGTVHRHTVTLEAGRVPTVTITRKGK